MSELKDPYKVFYYNISIILIPYWAIMKNVINAFNLFNIEIRLGDCILNSCSLDMI